MSHLGRRPFAAEPIAQGVFHVLVDAVKPGRVAGLDLRVLRQAAAGEALGPEGPEAGRMLQHHGEQRQDLTADAVKFFHGSGGSAKALAQLPLPNFRRSVWVVTQAAEQQVKHPVPPMLLSVRPKGGIGAG